MTQALLPDLPGVTILFWAGQTLSLFILLSMRVSHYLRCQAQKRSQSPQRAQRRLLRLRQSFHPADIESLVGSVTPQCSQMLGGLQVPERDGPIIAAAGQEATIRTYLERLHRPLVCFA